MLSELSAYIKLLYLPVRDEPRALLFPRALQVREGCLVEHVGNRAVDALPHVRERGICVAAESRFLVARAFNETEYFTDLDGIRRPRQQVPAFGSPARFHK